MLPDSDSGMDPTLYDEAAPAKEEAAAPDKSVDEQNAEKPTALLPVSALGKGVKVGDSITVTVTKVMGDEATVELSGSSEEETETATMGEPSPEDVNV